MQTKSKNNDNGENIFRACPSCESRLINYDKANDLFICINCKWEGEEDELAL